MPLDGIAEAVIRGAFKFVILMDEVPAELRDLIHFVNRSTRFSIYTVELRHYPYQELHLFVPQVFGAKARKVVSELRLQGRGDEESLFGEL